MKDLPAKFKKFFIANFIIAMLLSLWLIYKHSWSGIDLTHLVIFSILSIGSESLPIALPKGGYVTVGYAVFISALILFPVGVVIPIVIVGGVLIFGKAAEGQVLYKRIFNSSQYVISISLASFVLNTFNLGHSIQFNISAISIYIIAALTYMLTNMTIVSIALGQLSGKPPWAIWVGNIRWSIPNFLALAPLGILMAMIYTNYNAIGLILLFVPLLLSRHSFQLYIDIRKNYLNTVEALVQALEAKDSYTSGHSSRVAQFSVELAEELKLSEDRVEFIKYAGVLHDVGKIGVSESILNKAGRLSEPEWEMIRSHPSIGQNIIKSIDFLFDVGQVVKCHHERIDGKGYPEGLKGDEIPLESRIIAIADTYDAMTSNRSYRKGKTVSEALDELQSVAGTQLDAQLVEIFCRIVRRELKLEENSKNAQFA